jgi:ribokinase
MSVRLPTVAVIGSINIDTTFSVERLPHPGETLVAFAQSECLGGKGANQAAALARLGAPVVMVSAVGDDVNGRAARSELASLGIDVRGVVRSAQSTGTASIYLDAARENSIVVWPGANATVAAPEDPLHAEVLLAQLEIDPRVVEEAVDRFDGFVALNAAPARPLSTATLERADLVIVNELEYEQLDNIRHARRVVVTSGADGARLVEGGRLVAKVRSWPAAVVNTVGAGDAFSAAITLAIAADIDDLTALEIAVRVGAVAVESEVSQPPLDTFEHYLRHV